jgi:hypothetical protein
MEIYPGYNVDPRVRQVVDRCIAIGINNFNKPYSNKEELFKFSTLERDICRPAKVPVTDRIMRKKLIRSSKPGVLVLRGIAHTKEGAPAGKRKTTAAYRTRYVQEADLSGSASSSGLSSASTLSSALSSRSSSVDQFAGGVIRI